MIFNNANNTPDEWVFIDRCAVPDAKHLYGRALRRKLFKCASYKEVVTLRLDELSLALFSLKNVPVAYNLASAIEPAVEFIITPAYGVVFTAGSWFSILASTSLVKERAVPVPLEKS